MTIDEIMQKIGEKVIYAAIITSPPLKLAARFYVAYEKTKSQKKADPGYVMVQKK